MGDAEEFFFELRVVAGFIVERRMRGEEEEGVSDGLEGIVDLVSDDAGDASHGNEPFGFAERFLCPELRGDVTVDLEDGIAVGFDGLTAGDDDVAAITGDLGKIAVPLSVARKCFADAAGSYGSGKRVSRSSSTFLPMASLRRQP